MVQINQYYGHNTVVYINQYHRHNAVEINQYYRPNTVDINQYNGHNAVEINQYHGHNTVVINKYLEHNAEFHTDTYLNENQTNANCEGSTVPKSGGRVNMSSSNQEYTDNAYGSSY